MDNGLLIALAFGFFIIVLAIVLTRLTRMARGPRGPEGPRDGRAAATWEGIRQARNIDTEDR